MPLRATIVEKSSIMFKTLLVVVTISAAFGQRKELKELEKADAAVVRTRVSNLLTRAGRCV